MTKLTKFLTGFTKEEKVIGFIKSWLEDKGYPPSVREIGKGVGLRSTKAVKYHLDNLVAKGQLTRKPYHARTLELKKELLGLPLVGRIAAGTPTLAVENIEDYISLDEQYAGCFLLKVKGDSMKQAGIFNDDFVIIRPQKTVNNGDIIAALLGEEATVKRFYRDKKQILLKPENPDYSTIIVDPVRNSNGVWRVTSSKSDNNTVSEISNGVNEIQNFSIIGLVVGVLKKYK